MILDPCTHNTQRQWGYCLNQALRKSWSWFHNNWSFRGGRSGSDDPLTGFIYFPSRVEGPTLFLHISRGSVCLECWGLAEVQLTYRRAASLDTKYFLPRPPNNKTLRPPLSVSHFAWMLINVGWPHIFPHCCKHNKQPTLSSPTQRPRAGPRGASTLPVSTSKLANELTRPQSQR